MIGKVVKGRSFKGCISYVLDKENVKLIDSEGVLLNDTKSIINSFYMQSLMNPDLSKCVGHIPLSYAKEDEPKLTDAFMVQLAKEYMEAMKIKNTQYIIVRHNNTPIPHCHIIFNRVDNDGETISDKKDWHENIKVCKVLKEKYNLTYGKGKELVNTNKLRGAEKTKYEIYHSIKTALLMSKNWQQFEHTLKLQGVSINYKYKGQTDEVQGISFKKGEHSFKGSDIDRKFSFSKLNSQLQGNEQLYNNNQQKHPQPKESPTQSNSTIESTLDAFGGIANFQQHGDDYQEEIFKNRMEHEEEQRKKKKRKGFRL